MVVGSGTRSIRHCAVVLVGVLVATMALATAVPASAAGAAVVKRQAKKVKVATMPEQIRSVKAKVGKKPGTAVVTWKASSKYVSYFELELASTSFSTKIASLPNKGLDYRKVKIPRNARSFTISAKLAAKAGAPVGSGNHIQFRLRAVNAAGKKKLIRAYPYQQTIHTAPVKPGKTGARIRLASYNVASVRATLNRKGQTWLDRRGKVAQKIVASGADVVALQELGPGNVVDGGSINGGTLTRQTDSLEQALRATSGGQSYRLVKRNGFKEPGTLQATQGSRILYNSSKVAEISQCQDTTWWPQTQRYRDFSDSCTITLPILGSDTKAQERKASYALMQDLSTGARFWFVSAHLDPRKSPKRKQALKFDRLRAKQANRIVKTMNQLNTGNYPILLGGDMNSSQYNQVGGASAHKRLLKAGYQDASAAKKRKGTKLPTSNQWNKKVTPPGSGYGARIDYLMTRGVQGSLEYVNTMKRKDTARESDHALIYATVRVPVTQ